MSASRAPPRSGQRRSSRPFSASYRNPEEFEIVRDEVDDNGAVLETYHFGWTDLQIARWVDGRDRIVTCHLSLHEEHAELKAAFEDACLAIDSPALATG